MLLSAGGASHRKISSSKLPGVEGVGNARARASDRPAESDWECFSDKHK
jgi:hypothetical protein